MLETWLRPVAPTVESLCTSLLSYQFGHHIHIYTEKKGLPPLKNAQLAIIGLDAKAADAVRQHLYALSFPFASLNAVDLGNVRKYHSETIIPVLKELLSAGIVPILIGGNDADLPYMQYRSYRHLEQMVTIGLVSDKIPYLMGENWQLKPDFWLNRIVSPPENYLFNLSVLGYQSHFTNPSVLTWLEARYFEYLRLGRLKQHLDEAEPLLRDADLVCINLNAVKQADAPAVSQPSPNGLTAEELCQLCRYAGFSDKLSSFSLYNMVIETDQTTQTAQLAAQAIWYFIDGFASRKHDYPVVATHFNEYVVQLNDLDKPLTFWKSNRSERWWLQVPTQLPEKKQRHQLFPCSYQDYLNACNNQLSDRLLVALSRFN